MRRFIRGVCLASLFVGGMAGQTLAQKALTWDEVKTQFEANNPILRAGQIGIDESKANEITAYLRPNPSLGLTVDQINPFNGGPPHSTFGSLLTVANATYLHERQHKRELRLSSAQQATGITVSGQADLERSLLFNLRGAFVGALQAKAVLQLAKDNLAYWDQVISISRNRFHAGDLAQIDLDRLELQRVQFEGDLQSAEVNLRTTKIELLLLLNDRTPVDQFDVTGTFDFSDQLSPLDEFRQIALDTRPDLKVAALAVDKAKTDHKLAVANGSTDPTFSFDVGRNPPIDQYIGAGVNFPLRIFDRNQGEKLRTQLDIDRNQKLLDATQARVFSDVDSAYAMVNSNLVLLHPYKARYLRQAVLVRETVRFAYEHGGSSLLDFISAENDYRSVQLNYANLIGAYLTAAAQLNLAVGREVLR
jgi:cobalt-zinc-cadmium efflux system outer membrane protein